MKNFLKKKGFRILAAMALVPILFVGFSPKPEDHSLQVEIYYSGKLEELQKQLVNLQTLCQQKAAVKKIQQAFRTARLCYKSFAPISEYFNVGESRYLNGPPVSWSQEDVPDIIIPPQGFQALENILFGSGDSLYFHATEELRQIRDRVTNLQEEKDRRNKFDNAAVWDALRAAVLKSAVLDITGYESPLALAGLQEAQATLRAVASVAAFYCDEMPPRSRPVYQSFLRQINRTQNQLGSLEQFNTADRLQLLTDYFNPLYGQLIRLRKILSISVPAGRYPVNANAESIFDSRLMNISSFAPEKDFLPTADRIELGKRLFYDSILSGTGTRSCASCHQPEKAFTDGVARPLDLGNEKLLTRNTPTLLNAGFQTRQFLDSREDILENQINAVVHNVEEMKGSLLRISESIGHHPSYGPLFRKAYANEKNPYTPFNIGNAIASYIRSLVSLNSRFDQYMRGNRSAMTQSEKKGFNLFAGKARCATCHFIPLFNGLVPPAFTETESEILGVPMAGTAHPLRLDTDQGKFGFTRSSVHEYAFKIPTLRNIELTAPYMHNGVYQTLEQVMDFYNKGGGIGLGIGPESQTLSPDPLRLTKSEINDIIAFLKSLTDTSSYHRPLN